MRPRPPHAGHLAAKPTLVPLRPIVSDERKFGCEHPPLAREREITALHFVERDIFSPAYFDAMFVKAPAQRPLGFGGARRCLSDVNELVLEVQSVDPAGERSCAFRQGKGRTGFELFDNLSANAPVEVEIKMVRVVSNPIENYCHSPRDIIMSCTQTL